MISSIVLPAALRRETDPADRQVIIQAADLVKTYSTGDITVPALQGVDLQVSQGEMVAIMGPSGCGKTTLLNSLSGIDTIDSGTILIDGLDLAVLTDNARTEYRAENMGFIFQFYNLLPVLSAVENVELPLLVSGATQSTARDKAIQMLGLVGLTDWANHRPAELSGGQRQRVTIARALINEPAIVWADEPTGDLDSENAAEVMELMIDLNERHGQTFVIVTHDPGIGAMTERIVRMQDGRIHRDERTER